MRFFAYGISYGTSRSLYKKISILTLESRVKSHQSPENGFLLSFQNQFLLWIRRWESIRVSRKSNLNDFLNSESSESTKSPESKISNMLDYRKSIYILNPLKERNSMMTFVINFEVIWSINIDIQYRLKKIFFLKSLFPDLEKSRQTQLFW